MLQQYFDKVYFINDRSRDDRYTHCLNEFSKHGIVAEHFPAVKGSDFKKVYHWHNANANGCTLAHYQIIDRAKFLGLESVFILEDDPMIHDEFGDLLPKVMMELPSDWDVLYLAASHNQTPIKTSDHIYKLQHSDCIHAIGIKNTLFDWILKTFPSFKFPGDRMMANNQKQMNAYISNPPLIWQISDYSDVEGRVTDYNWLKKPLDF